MEILLRELLFDADDLPAPSCHAATLVETSSGLLAAWFGGTREGHADVGIWGSRQIAGRWSRASQIVPPVDGEPCWNPVLAGDDGRVILYFKRGPSPPRWHGHYVESVDEGESWGGVVDLPQGLIGPVKNKPHRLRSGEWLHPSSTEHDGWRCHFELGAERFAVPDPEGLRAIQPTILARPEGLVALVRTRAGAIGRTESADGRTWTPLARTSLQNPNSGIDGVTLADGRHVLVYNPVADDRRFGPRTPLVAAQSTDTEGWSEVLVLEDGPGEYSYPAVIEGSSGDVHVVYTHHRTNLCHVVIRV